MSGHRIDSYSSITSRRDAHRYGIERMAPPSYLRSSYYERWLASFEYLLIEQGIISGDELDAPESITCAGIPMPHHVRVASTTHLQRHASP